MKEEKEKLPIQDNGEEISRGKKQKQKTQRLRDLWVNNKCSNDPVIGIPQRVNKSVGMKEYSKK